MLKKCSKCKEEKELSNFCKNRSHKDGLNSSCKQCRAIYCKKYKASGKATILSLKRREDKLCRSCSKESLKFSRFCLFHFVDLLVRNLKIDKQERLILVEKLILKLEKSEYSCFYTGVSLLPGFNASIDHRVPQSKGGTHTIENLEWVHVSVNRIKNQLSEIEFVNSSLSLLTEINFLGSKGVI